MLTVNRSQQRSIILSKDAFIIQSLKSILEDNGGSVDIFNNRKFALKCFLQYRHILFFIDAEFLPRHPHRLLQLFKMALRTPGMVIFKTSGKNIVGFKHIKDCIVDIVELPSNKVRIQNVITAVRERLNARTRKLFFKDFIIQAGVAIPLVVVVIYSILRKAGG